MHTIYSYTSQVDQYCCRYYLAGVERFQQIRLGPLDGYVMSRVDGVMSAREILQLFSIGLVRLNIDGSIVRDANGAPVPTYDEDVVKGFAQAFTGWSSGMGRNFHDIDVNVEANWFTPMKSYPAYHSTGDKLLLDSFVLPAGGTPESDLEAAIDNVFNHPNVGPFVCRQLIQRLVTSNPSPAYISAVASTFNNNGAGVRGDLRAVVRAILLHPEARDPALGANGRFGKQREPVLRFANFLRGLGARSANGLNSVHELDGSDNSLGQSPMLAPTVFNFYSFDYAPQPGQQVVIGPLPCL